MEVEQVEGNERSQKNGWKNQITSRNQRNQTQSGGHRAHPCVDKIWNLILYFLHIMSWIKCMWKANIATANRHIFILQSLSVVAMSFGFLSLSLASLLLLYLNHVAALMASFTVSSLDLHSLSVRLLADLALGSRFMNFMSNQVMNFTTTSCCCRYCVTQNCTKINIAHVFHGLCAVCVRACVRVQCNMQCILPLLDIC